MHNENKNNNIKEVNKSTTEPEILRAAKEGMPLSQKNDAIEENINRREYGVQYGMDNTANYNVNAENKCGCNRGTKDKKDDKNGNGNSDNGSGSTKGEKSVSDVSRGSISSVDNAMSISSSRSKTNKDGSFAADPSEMRKAPGYNGSVPGVNTPEIRLPGAEMKQDVSIPAFNPPVPNRAWTAMRKGMDIEELSEEERRDLYVGRDRYF